MSEHDGTTYTPSVLDDVLFLPDQDVHEPVEETDAQIEDMRAVDDPNDQYAQSPLEVRTAFGFLEFFHDLKDEAEALLDVADVPAATPAAGPKLDAIRTRELGADRWRAGRRIVTADMQYPLVVDSPFRRKLTLVNYGPNVVYISATTGPKAGSPNTVSLLVSSATFYAPITLEIKDTVYAVCAPTQTGEVHIIEEFDMQS
jgi:hypothetical protein